VWAAVQALESEGAVDVEVVGRELVAACACRNYRQVTPSLRFGTGGIFRTLRTRQIVDRLVRWPNRLAQTLSVPVRGFTGPARGSTRTYN
jgi:hypothetical protein